MHSNLLIFFVLTTVYCAVKKKVINNDIDNRMMGIDTVHDVKIDKNTIITRNIKLETKEKRKSAHTKEREAQEPDWSYSSFPEEVASHVEQFKLNMTECLKEVQDNDKGSVKRLSPGKDSPVHGECLIACVLKRNGVIENRKVNKENLISLVSKFYAKDTRLMKKLQKNLDRCVELSAGSRDECALAARLNDCTNDLMIGNKHKISVNY